MYKAPVCFGSVTSGANAEKGGLQLNKMYLSHIKLIHADIIISLKSRLKLPFAYGESRIQFLFLLKFSYTHSKIRGKLLSYNSNLMFDS
jgi:hypothetical protein